MLASDAGTLVIIPVKGLGHASFGFKGKREGSVVERSILFATQTTTSLALKLGSQAEGNRPHVAIVGC